MRRILPPFDGKRFLLNTNAGEIHDLDRETPLCKIDDIKPEHIEMFDSYELAKSSMLFIRINSQDINGCYHCIPSKDNG